jgi:hypothetical protein
VLAGFSFAGPSGLALFAVFTGLSGLLHAPVKEYFMILRYRKGHISYGNFGNRALGALLAPFRACWLLTPVFLAALVFISLAGGVHPLLVLGEGAGFTGIFILSHWIISRRGDAQGHVRFVPALIRKVPVKDLAFFRIMFPCILASLLSVLLPPLFPGLVPAGTSSLFEDEGLIIHEAEYRAHAAFQGSFSYRVLGGDALGEPAYFRYILGDDGLIAGAQADFPAQEDIPPFPLRDLMNFLETKGKPAPGDRGFLTAQDLVSVLAVLLFSLPAILRPVWGDKKKKKRLLYKYKEKGIAA